jgi:hypothetical protein
MYSAFRIKFEVTNILMDTFKGMNKEMFTCCLNIGHRRTELPSDFLIITEQYFWAEELPVSTNSQRYIFRCSELNFHNKKMQLL